MLVLKKNPPALRPVTLELWTALPPQLANPESTSVTSQGADEHRGPHLERSLLDQTQCSGSILTRPCVDGEGQRPDFSVGSRSPPGIPKGITRVHAHG